MDNTLRNPAIGRPFSRERLRLAADQLAMATAVSIPWSTSATGVLIVLWLCALLPTLDRATIGRELATAAGGLPLALWACAALGMLWADASWGERLAGIGGYHKLLAVPLLLAQFRRSGRGLQVAGLYLASVIALLALSWGMVLWPGLQAACCPKAAPGVPVKDYIAQSGEFVACAFVLLYFAGQAARQGRKTIAAAAVVLAGGLLTSVAYVATGRTALVVIPVLLLILGLRTRGWRGVVSFSTVGLVLASTAWISSPYLRERVLRVGADVEQFQVGDFETSSGQRLAFWTRSIRLIEQAPLVGHGTMTHQEIFRRSAVGSTGITARITANPHNQVFAIAIQLGLLGAGLLVAMWTAHLLLFCGKSLTAWIGLVIVVQNIVSSLFNSHLLDFTQGWTYVFGVGVLGGALLRGQSSLDGAARS
ncbi:MAG: O-antigen ligase family protein [Xanthobacteraceae bacterium]